MAEEIKLASDTLRWLNSLQDSELPVHVATRMRDLIANLLDFQYGFSLPLDLGLSSGSKLSQPLPIERPIAPLVRWGCAFKVQASEIESFEANDNERDGQDVYCLIGGPTWESQVESGKIEGEGATEPVLDASDWMIDLFDIFAHVADHLDSQRKAVARRLAACWYNVAMAVSFEKVDEEAEMGLSKADVMAMMFGGLSLGAQGDDDDLYDEEGEEDFEESEAPKKASLLASLMKGDLNAEEDDDDDYDPSKDPKDDGEDIEIEEDANEEEEEEKPKNTTTGKIPYEQRRKQLALMALQADPMAGDVLDGEDDDEDYNPEKDSNDDGLDDEGDDLDGEEGLGDENGEDGEDAGYDDEEREEEEDEESRKQREEEFRVRVLGAVEKLGAQWPSVEDQSWLKRILKMMSIADETEQAWFPWGMPAIEPLNRSAKSNDELERNHALSILALYQERASTSN